MKRYILIVVVSIASSMLFHCFLLWILWTLNEKPEVAAVVIADCTMLFLFGIIFNGIVYES